MVYEEKHFDRAYLRQYADNLVGGGLGTSVMGEDNKTFSFTSPEFNGLEVVVRRVDLCLLGSARPLQTVIRGNRGQVKKFIDIAEKSAR